MLKATSGGGGRGIRRCNSAEELRRNYDRVISEATKAFGSADMFMEKCIVNPRHIEVQILADSHGNVIHLFERDCSIQRRNQKLIEIAPSPQLDEEQRVQLGDMAVRAARAVDYQNAGTVEFLLDRNGQFYFMEMNTRLQVEHTITEQITGIDIVQQQIRIAAGQPLSYRQDEVRRRGFAIQFRINAEDPQNDFLPSFGRITRYYAPGGPGVRTDTRDLHRLYHPALLRFIVRQAHRLGIGLERRIEPRAARPQRHRPVWHQDHNSVLSGDPAIRRVLQRQLRHRLCRIASGTDRILDTAADARTRRGHRLGGRGAYGTIKQ